MSNLENLVEKILDDAKDRANSIMEDANRDREEILAAKIREANDNKKRLLDNAAREAELAKERVISSAELKARNQKLLAKQKTIEKTFDLAKEGLKSLEDERFTRFLIETIKSLDLSGDELLILPEDYKAKSSKLGIKISKDEFVESGFLIKDKGIILNYKFDSLVDYYREELETVIASELFKEEE